MLRALLPLLLLCGLFYSAFWVGGRMARGRDDTRLTNPEKKELKRLRNFEADALNMAHEHLAYGDPLATLIIDLGRKELP
jgi:hypothetical protein